VETDLELVAQGGRIVLFGNAVGGPLAPLPQAGRLFGGNLSIGGFSISRFAANAPEIVARALTDVLAELDGTAGAQQALAEGRAGSANTSSASDRSSKHALKAAGRARATPRVSGD
jgi:NADPH2:quinone reductase